MDVSRGMISTSNCCWRGLKAGSHKETSINKKFLAVVLYCYLNKKKYSQGGATGFILASFYEVAMGGNVEPRTQSQIARISWCASCDITSELYALK